MAGSSQTVIFGVQRLEKLGAPTTTAPSTRLVFFFTQSPTQLSAFRLGIFTVQLHGHHGNLACSAGNTSVIQATFVEVTKF